MKLSDYVINAVADAGVKHVFMLPGGGAMHLNDSLGRSKRLEYVCNLHEQACAIAAEAYGQYTNNLGVCMVTTGPGSPIFALSIGCPAPEGRGRSPGRWQWPHGGGPPPPG